ncbi:hypothetical protein OHB06_39145 [Streptomyces sp. NBC_01604]|uniref:hypothetical protein n=1 Tax=Streptomyces sp. NBC_01604 TaxID=2975894 RepID=UPI0038705EE0
MNFISTPQYGWGGGTGRLPRCGAVGGLERSAGCTFAAPGFLFAAPCFIFASRFRNASILLSSSARLMSFVARVRPGGAAERPVVDWQARCTGCPPVAKTSFFLATGRRHTTQR